MNPLCHASGLEEAFPAIKMLLDTMKRRGLIGTFTIDSSDYDPVEIVTVPPSSPWPAKRRCLQAALINACLPPLSTLPHLASPYSRCCCCHLARRQWRETSRAWNSESGARMCMCRGIGRLRRARCVQRPTPSHPFSLLFSLSSIANLNFLCFSIPFFPHPHLILPRCPPLTPRRHQPSTSLSLTIDSPVGLQACLQLGGEGVGIKPDLIGPLSLPGSLSVCLSLSLSLPPSLPPRPRPLVYLEGAGTKV